MNRSERSRRSRAATVVVVLGSTVAGALSSSAAEPPRTTAAIPASPPRATTPSKEALVTGWATTIVRMPPARRGDVALARAIPGEPREPHALAGDASFYWQFTMTASGEAYDPRSMTAAHRTLPFGTRVRVTNMSNGKTAIVRINNRGPFKAGRVIDLSEAAADAIDMRKRGIVPVRLEVLTP